MATFYVKHHLYPDNPQLFTINISQIVKIKGEPGTAFKYNHMGEQFWEVSIHTTGMDANGDILAPVWIDEISSEESVDIVVKENVANLCSLIDWSRQGDFSIQEDKNQPFLEEQYPASNQTSVPIQSTIKLVVKENLPSKGMDINTMYLKVKGITVNPTVVGTPYKYTITYSPTPLI